MDKGEEVPHEEEPEPEPERLAVVDVARHTLSVADIGMPRFVPTREGDEAALGHARRLKANTEAALERVRTGRDAGVVDLAMATCLLQFALKRLGEGPKPSSPEQQAAIDLLTGRGQDDEDERGGQG
jgi:hypothetical protein